MTVYRLGTRGSVLATTQSGHVAQALGDLGVECELVVIRTEGDTNRASLAQLGGTGVFAAQLREALLEGRCDLAVHSLKDLPTAQPDGLVIGAVPPRADPSDVLCSASETTLADLPPGARVGTGSPRRVAQLLDRRPDLDVVDLRGNVDTRLARVFGPDADLDAVVLARAGLERLGRFRTVPHYSDGSGPDVVLDADGVPRSVEVLDLLPAPGQGALAVEVRADDDTDLTRAVRALDHAPSRQTVTVERALLARLGAGCSAPVGALATIAATDGGTPQWSVELQAVVGTATGLVHRYGRASIPAPAAPLPRWTVPSSSRWTEARPALVVDDVESLGARVADDLLAVI